VDTTGAGPLLPRRRLGAALRAAREARGETLQETAQAVMFSPSKLSRIENGQAGDPHPRDVRDLLAHFAITGARARELDALAEEARRPGWWQVPPYDMPSRLDTFISYENAASDIDVYSPSAVPGLLQTADYAHAVLSRLLPTLTPAEVARQAELRLERRRRMEARAVQPRQRYIVPETILLRQVGSVATMNQQLSALVEETARPGIEFHLIPFSAGMYEAMELTTVTIFGFADEADPDVVCIERVRHADFSDRPQTLTKYREIFDRLQDYWLDPPESRRFVDRIRREKWQD
jgi:transcriptional regulator with XRE-family HTH domain